MADVVIAAASDPAPGSVRQYAPSCSIEISPGSHRSRCASSPYASIIHATMLWIVRYAVTVGSPAASSSKISTAKRRGKPAPPDSSRTQTPPSPSSPARRSTSRGKCFVASHSSA
ncbi:hypothetical protein SRABI128_02637 [Microbacterium sp. Bi128]|nr:hypothetical protein SRABI128_02637 [Microbacterium sp. Bi128]